MMILNSRAYTDQSFKPAKYIHEMKFGALIHDIDGLWSGFSREDGVDFNVETILAPRLKLFNGSLRPALGASINSAGGTSKIYLDGRWQYDFKNRFFIALGVGAAFHNGEKDPVTSDMKALGADVLFHIPMELGGYITDRISLGLFFDHVSNGNLSDYNEGLDTLGLRLGYRF